MDRLNKGQEIYSLEDTPSWVKIHSVPDDIPTDDSPFTFPLVDYQEHISDTAICSYRNTYQCVNAASRIEDASLNLIELHQESQKLLIHELSVIRGGKKIDALDLENISAIQRETSLESHITNNRITVSISIDDLRQGDHVQFRSTVVERQSDHPFHGKHFSTNYSLSWSCPVSLQIIRVINNSKQHLSVLCDLLNHEKRPASIEAIEPNHEFEQEYTDLPIERIPETAPEWVWGSYMQISSSLSWEELSLYLYSYFEQSGAISTLSANDIQNLDIFAVDDDLEQKAIKIIRFVQNNIRYRGENHGIFTHTPKPADRTLKKRAGDCKDKSNLMITMLAAIGVSARLVLVNTQYGKKVNDFNPSPYHFNHMIVDVEFENQHFYIDATIQKQAGNFQHATQLDYGFGLPLSSNGSKLVKIFKSLKNKVFELTHYFELPRNKDNSSFSIERVYYYHRADNMRSYFGSNEKSKYQLDFLEWAKNDTGLNLKTIEPISVHEDDNFLNKLVVKEKYQIIDIKSTHNEKKIELLTDFYQDFPKPNSNDFPVSINLDGSVQHDIFVKYDKRPSMDLSQDSFKSKGVDYLDFVEEIDEDKLHYRTTVSPLMSFVNSGEDAKQHKKDIERMQQRSNNLISNENKSTIERLTEGFVDLIILSVFCMIIIKAIRYIAEMHS